MQFCNGFNLVIVSGLETLHTSSYGTFSGNFTYISSTGCSVIDYFIVSETLLRMCHLLSVLPMVESKHMPVELKYLTRFDSRDQEKQISECNFEKFIWKGDKILVSDQPSK